MARASLRECLRHSAQGVPVRQLHRGVLVREEVRVLDRATHPRWPHAAVKVGRITTHTDGAGVYVVTQGHKMVSAVGMISSGKEGCDDGHQDNWIALLSQAFPELGGGLEMNYG